MLHEYLSDGGMDPSDINNFMSAFKAKAGKPPQETSRKISTHQRYVFARANQSTDHLVNRGANGGLAGADMRILQKPDRKINFVGIDDHELTGLDVVTAPPFFDTQKGTVIGILCEYAHLRDRDLHMLLDKWNGLTEKWITDPKLWVVPKGLKPLMDMCSHSLLNLDWFLCTLSWFLLMMTCSNTLMFPSHYLIFGMVLFWIMVLPCTS